MPGVLSLVRFHLSHTTVTVCVVVGGGEGRGEIAV